MKPRSLVAVGFVAIALGALAWWLLAQPSLAPPAPHAQSPARPDAASAPDASLAAVEPRPHPARAGSTGTTPHDTPAAPAPGASSRPPSAGAPAPPAAPFSTVPHQMLRGWDAAQGKTRRLDLVVDSSLPTPALEQLARDALAHHPEADVLAVDIYDSEEAASYDRHRDGGALAERHLIARVRRHRALDFESIQVRGAEIPP